MTTTPRNALSLVFIDASLPDLQTLQAGLPADATVHLLDIYQDGLAQIAGVLSEHSDVAAIHLISHGEPGILYMGSSTICRSDLPYYKVELETIANAMAEDGEILIYGCEVAAGKEGRAFVETLRQITGLKVAAATHKVGATELGGDWALNVGMPMTSTLQVDAWHHVLAVTSFSLELGGTNAAQWNRPDPYNQDQPSSGAQEGPQWGTFTTADSANALYNYAYVKFTPSFTVEQAGTFDFKVANTSISDSMMFIYQAPASGDFLDQSGNPLGTLLVGDDDSSDTYFDTTYTLASGGRTAEDNFWPGIKGVSLTSGQEYYLVISSYTEADEGKINFNVTGPVALSVTGTLAAPIVVTNTDDIGDGSLRAALAAASAGDTITFDSALTGTITLGTSLSVGDGVTIDFSDVNSSLTIAGSSLVFGANSATLKIGTGDTVTLSAPITSTADGSITKIGEGTLHLSGNGNGTGHGGFPSAADFEGMLNINEGQVTFAGSGLPDHVTLNGGQLTQSTNDPYSGTITVAENGGTIKVASPYALTTTLEGSGTLTVDGMVNPSITGFTGDLILKSGQFFPGELGATHFQNGTGQSITTGNIEVQAGAWIYVADGQSVTVANGKTLTGNGQVQGDVIVASGGTIDAGSDSTAGTLTLTKNLTVQAGGTVSAQIGSTTAGTGYDQIVVTGTVDVTGASLDATLIDTFTPAGGDSFVLISNENADAVTGAFTSAAQDATVSVSGTDTTVSYTAGSGNDVTLTVASAAVDFVLDLDKVGVDSELTTDSTGLVDWDEPVYIADSYVLGAGAPDTYKNLIISVDTTDWHEDSRSAFGVADEEIDDIDDLLNEVLLSADGTSGTFETDDYGGYDDLRVQVAGTFGEGVVTITFTKSGGGNIDKEDLNILMENMFFYEDGEKFSDTRVFNISATDADDNVSEISTFSVTWVPDTEAPYVDGMDWNSVFDTPIPTNYFNAADGNYIEIYLNEEGVTPVAGKFVRLWKEVADGADVQVDSYEVTDEDSVYINGDTLQIYPSLDSLDSNTSYYFTIDAGAFKDTANNEFEAYDGLGQWSFSTAAPSLGTWNVADADPNSDGIQPTVSTTGAFRGNLEISANGKYVVMAEEVPYKNSISSSSGVSVKKMNPDGTWSYVGENAFASTSTSGGLYDLVVATDGETDKLYTVSVSNDNANAGPNTISAHTFNGTAWVKVGTDLSENVGPFVSSFMIAMQPPKAVLLDGGIMMVAYSTNVGGVPKVEVKYGFLAQFEAEAQNAEWQAAGTPIDPTTVKDAFDLIAVGGEFLLGIASANSQDVKFYVPDGNNGWDNTIIPTLSMSQMTGASDQGATLKMAVDGNGVIYAVYGKNDSGMTDIAVSKIDMTANTPAWEPLPAPADAKLSINEGGMRVDLVFDAENVPHLSLVDDNDVVNVYRFDGVNNSWRELDTGSSLDAINSLPMADLEIHDGELSLLVSKFGNELGMYLATYEPNPEGGGSDATPPAYQSASINGTTLTLTYDEALKSGGLPVAGDFTLKVNGNAVTDGISSVAINGSDSKKLDLTLANPVYFGQKVTISYTDPTEGNDANAIQDTTGNDIATFENYGVANATAATDSVVINSQMQGEQVSLAIGGGMSINAPSNSVAPSNLGKSVKMPLGKFAFNITAPEDVADGFTAQLSMTADADLKQLTYYKWNYLTNKYVNIAKSVALDNSTGKATVFFDLVDGGAYDADRLANGTIVDPGGLAENKLLPVIFENQSEIGDVRPLNTDSVNGTLRYSLTGGADKDKFEINETTGALSFKVDEEDGLSAPNFEAPTDAGDTALNNTYAVTVKITGSNGGSEVQPLIVTVMNVAEAGDPTVESNVTAQEATVSVTQPESSGGGGGSSSNTTTTPPPSNTTTTTETDGTKTTETTTKGDDGSETKEKEVVKPTGEKVTETTTTVATTTGTKETTHTETVSATGVKVVEEQVKTTANETKSDGSKVETVETVITSTNGPKVIETETKVVDTAGKVTENFVVEARAVTTTTTTTENAVVALYYGDSAKTAAATQASVPVGVALTSTGARTPTTNAEAVANLLGLIDTTASKTETNKTNMMSGGQTFLNDLAKATEKEILIVNKLTIAATTTDSGTGSGTGTGAGTVTAPAKPIEIIGAATPVQTNDGAQKVVEALVVDATAVAPNTQINLQNVELAVIVGEDLVLRGGAGQNKVFTGKGKQNIRLGEDDDELHAGDGDDIVGSEGGDDLIYGDSGNDTVFGGEGNDTLDGGTGSNVATYVEAGSAVSVSLLKLGVAQDTLGNGSDTLVNIQSLVGSAFNDTLVGNKLNNTIEGGAGDDKLDGGVGKLDMASYDSATSGVTVNLSLKTAQNTGGAGTDTLKGFEGVIGSTFDDTLIGFSGAALIMGGAGNDRLNTGKGVDTLVGGLGADMIDAGVSGGKDVIRYTGVDEGGDTILNFRTGKDKIEFVGSAFGGHAKGKLAKAEFVSGDGATAQTEAQKFIFDTATHSLYFDADGSGAGAAALIATVGTATIKVADIVFI